MEANQSPKRRTTPKALSDFLLALGLGGTSVFSFFDLERFIYMLVVGIKYTVEDDNELLTKAAPFGLFGAFTVDGIFAGLKSVVIRPATLDKFPNDTTVLGSAMSSIADGAFRFDSFTRYLEAIDDQGVEAWHKVFVRAHQEAISGPYGIRTENMLNIAPIYYRAFMGTLMATPGDVRLFATIAEWFVAQFLTRPESYSDLASDVNAFVEDFSAYHDKYVWNWLGIFSVHEVNDLVPYLSRTFRSSGDRYRNPLDEHLYPNKNTKDFVSVGLGVLFANQLFSEHPTPPPSPDDDGNGETSE